MSMEGHGEVFVDKEINRLRDNLREIRAEVNAILGWRDGEEYDERVVERLNELFLEVESLESVVPTLVEVGALSSDAQEQLERITELCDYLEYLVSNLWETREEAGRGYAFAAHSAVQAIETTRGELTAEINAWSVARAQVPTDTPPLVQSIARSMWDWLVTHLKPLIVKVSRHLWQVIAGMLTPQSWTLQGGVSIPGLANAQVSITFGPGP